MFMTMEGTSGRARLSVALLAALTVSACADQGVSPVGPEETAAFAKGGKGIDGENQDKVAPSVRNSCGIKTSPIPPLPNIYASVRGEFSGSSLLWMGDGVRRGREGVGSVDRF
jgi:hypothetical protein